MHLPEQVGRRTSAGVVARHVAPPPVGTSDSPLTRGGPSDRARNADVTYDTSDLLVRHGTLAEVLRGPLVVLRALGRTALAQRRRDAVGQPPGRDQEARVPDHPVLRPD